MRFLLESPAKLNRNASFYKAKRSVTENASSRVDARGHSPFSGCVGRLLTFR